MPVGREVRQPCKGGPISPCYPVLAPISVIQSLYLAMLHSSVSSCLVAEDRFRWIRTSTVLLFGSSAPRQADLQRGRFHRVVYQFPREVSSGTPIGSLSASLQWPGAHIRARREFAIPVRILSANRAEQISGCIDPGVARSWCEPYDQFRASRSVHIRHHV